MVEKMAGEEIIEQVNASNEEFEQPWPNSFYAWYVVTILTLAYTVSFIDRQILNLLVEPIKADLSLSDTQISLLQGLAFAIFYSVLGVPIGRLADRSNRRNVIALGIFVWCLMTAACGLAKNFLQLFIARIGVGVGEAALSPPAYSIISDYFPPNRLAKATGMYALGVYAGAGIAMLVGGAVIDLVGSAETRYISYLGILRPWQMAFIMVGLPGLIACGLMFTVKEPKRRDAFNEHVPSHLEVSYREVFNFILSRKSFFISIFLGLSMIGMVIVAILSWTPTYFIRLHSWSATEVGYRYGLILLIFGTSGSFLGGWFADWLSAKGFPDATIRTTIGVCLIATPFAIAMTIVPSSTQSLALLIPVTFLLASPVGLTAAAVQLITPNRMRAQITAVYFLIVALIGTGIGPLTVALTTDFIFGDDLAVGKSISIVCALLMPIGIVSLRYGLNREMLPSTYNNDANKTN